MANQNHQCNIFISIKKTKIIFLWSLIILLVGESRAQYSQDVTIDYLLLSVRWLPTGCKEWKVKRGGSCRMPNNPNVWAIHGLWPQGGQEIGPFYCNQSLIFDINELSPIREDLQQDWPDVHMGKPPSSFWQHEWSKHGTCAVVLEPLNTQLKFFQRTIQLFRQYNLNQYTNQIKIYPSSQGLYIMDFHRGVKSVFGRTFTSHCVKLNGDHFLSEIRMCFTTDLEPVDCDSPSLPGRKSPITDCPLNSPVMYPDTVDAQRTTHKTLSSKTNSVYYSQLSTLLRIVKFLLWSFL